MAAGCRSVIRLPPQTKQRQSGQTIRKIGAKDDILNGGVSILDPDPALAPSHFSHRASILSRREGKMKGIEKVAR
jgi:hypothetical protein